MTSYHTPQFSETKAQPWKNLIKIGGSTALTMELYGERSHVSAMERGWFQQSEVERGVHQDGRVATSGAAHSPTVEALVATSGAAHSPNVEGLIATSGAAHSPSFDDLIATSGIEHAPTKD
jgi:hypothetical protein